LDIKSGVYYGLNAVSASVWNIIQEPKTVTGIKDAILNEYEVDPSRCERDVLRLLKKRADTVLIEASNVKIQ